MGVGLMSPPASRHGKVLSPIVADPRQRKWLQVDKIGEMVRGVAPVEMVPYNIRSHDLEMWACQNPVYA